MSENLVDQVMREMEQKNGSWNEELGDFSNKMAGTGKPPAGDGEPGLEQLQQQFLEVIHNNQALKEAIDENQKYRQIINDILRHEGFLRDLFKNPSIIPSVIADLFNDEEGEGSDSPRAGANPKSILKNGDRGVSSPEDLDSIPSLSINQQLAKGELAGQKSDEINWVELLSGPAIAMVCYFLVTQTPLLYYLGQIPYIGHYLLSYKMVTEILTIGTLFVAMSFVLDFMR